MSQMFELLQAGEPNHAADSASPAKPEAPATRYTVPLEMPEQSPATAPQVPELQAPVPQQAVST
ncbi:MAG TPA: hypothetical protein VHA11_13855, partial [Bryobacteraceae bacterium]|nr:hypothetical protein [Bryobacteraceae bacterium]